MTRVNKYGTMVAMLLFEDVATGVILRLVHKSIKE